jgi:hypothetical protein
LEKRRKIRGTNDRQLVKMRIEQATQPRAEAKSCRPPESRFRCGLLHGARGTGCQLTPDAFVCVCVCVCGRWLRSSTDDRSWAPVSFGPSFCVADWPLVRTETDFSTSPGGCWASYWALRSDAVCYNWLLCGRRPNVRSGPGALSRPPG